MPHASDSCEYYLNEPINSAVMNGRNIHVKLVVPNTLSVGSFIQCTFVNVSSDTHVTTDFVTISHCGLQQIRQIDPGANTINLKPIGTMLYSRTREVCVLIIDVFEPLSYQNDFVQRAQIVSNTFCVTSKLYKN
jgi:hypothetical protein